MISILSAPGFQSRALPLSVAAWHGMVRDGLATCVALPVTVAVDLLFAGLP